MNKQGIVEVVHGVVGGTKVQAEQVVDAILESIVKTLKQGEEVSIAGLGIFSVKTRAAREARNPRTGEAIKVPAMKVPKFRPAKVERKRRDAFLQKIFGKIGSSLFSFRSAM